MSKNWSGASLWTGVGRFIVLALVCTLAQAKGKTTPSKIKAASTHIVNRLPASYVPDDDVIVKPVDNELSFYQQYVASDESDDVLRSRNQLKVWNDNQIFAQEYGMDASLAGSQYYVPTQDEKWEYFKSKYMRYLRARGEKPFKDLPQNWYNDFRATNQVDTINEMEARFKKTTKTSSTGNALPTALQEKQVSVWKKTKFIFQPRVDQGLAIIGMKTSFAYARAWVGINGKTELNIQQTYDSIGLRMMVNYEVDTKQYISSLDQRLMENIYARLTANGDPSRVQNSEDRTLMLIYATQF